MDMIKAAFDFNWKRISVGWTFISVMAMVMTNGINILFKSSDAYKVAIESISNNQEINDTSGGIIHFSDSVTGQLGAKNELNIGIVGKDKSFLSTVILDFDIAKEEYTVKSILIN